MRHAASKEALCAKVADLQDTEVAVIEAAEKVTAEVIRRNYPVVVGCAIQAGLMTGKLTLELQFDLTPGHKAVEVRGCVQPSPIISTIRHEVPSS